ncbi:MAG: hypothetical protein CMI18_11175 [Opitutaceae bacterium]|nr:hypothetical protein [Opitutaceae bacterium]|tara:strand:- start:302 stop:580 length:279 start_codon:yes stop_codon:yes gene_type:complete
MLDEEGQVEIWIHKPAQINEKLKKHLFKPYFSTKDSTRGLGTYSIKFLMEFRKALWRLNLARKRVPVSEIHTHFLFRHNYLLKAVVSGIILR